MLLLILLLVLLLVLGNYVKVIFSSNGCFSISILNDIRVTNEIITCLLMKLLLVSNLRIVMVDKKGYFVGDFVIFVGVVILLILLTIVIFVKFN